MNRSATISDDGQYRYTLSRSGWIGTPERHGRKLVWVMLNPSTADAEVDDPTIRRVISFTQREGYGEAVIVNLFALRAADPKALKHHPDPVGPDNDKTIEELAYWSVDLVCAWGAHPFARQRAFVLLCGPLLHRMPLCLGVTKGGYPRHPLYVAGGTPLVEFRW